MCAAKAKAAAVAAGDGPPEIDTTGQREGEVRTRAAEQPPAWTAPAWPKVEDL